MSKPINILGIETSCDETSIAVVANGREVKSSIIRTQIKDHAPFFGVVPEIASRKHFEWINPLLDKCLTDAGMSFSELNAIAVTYKPGLVGALLVGIQTAKTLSYVLDLPLVGVNHIYAHHYAPHMEHEIPIPNIGLVVSGGHTLLLLSKSHLEFEMIGSTIDDAVGEAFDKVAKHHELGYPGGPIIDKLSKEGDPTSFVFPKIKIKDAESPYHVSYSGLKTAAIYYKKKYLQFGKEDTVHNFCASFQKCAIDMLVEKTKLLAESLSISDIVISGGVSANSYLREVFAKESHLKSYFAKLHLCTDNAAMVAGLAYHHYLAGDFADLGLNANSKMVKQGALLA